MPLSIDKIPLNAFFRPLIVSRGLKNAFQKPLTIGNESCEAFADTLPPADCHIVRYPTAQTTVI